jgi:uncharacterized protein YecE (DUF72 family)
VNRLVTTALGLGKKLNLFLYQLPPHWHANPAHLEEFIAALPRDYRAAFEFRDPSWYQPENLSVLRRLLGDAGCALVVSIGGGQHRRLPIHTT